MMERIKNTSFLGLVSTLTSEIIWILADILLKRQEKLYDVVILPVQQIFLSEYSAFLFQTQDFYKFNQIRQWIEY